MKICIFLLILLNAIAGAQVPTTQLFSFEINQLTDSIYTFKNPRFLSNFNLEGYNNQPSFISDDKIYIAVEFPGAEQTDIFLLDLTSPFLQRVTDTPQSEYSPTPQPGGDRFSCIRVEKDSLQRLWSFPVDQSDNGYPVFETQEKIGYHCWIDHELAALFITGSPHTLVIAKIGLEKAEFVTGNIGRCLQKNAAGNLLFVDKNQKDHWLLKELDPYTLDLKVLTQTPTGSEDFVVLKDGSILMGSGSKIVKFHPSIKSDWMRVGDFAHLGINNITRLSYNGKNQLILVNRL